MSSIAIAAVGYNRPYAIKRLLNSLYEAFYAEEVDLIISIDKGKTQDQIVEIAQAFDWPYGEKKIRAFPERQGLRPHILQCGALTEEYDAVVVLEDDITVSKYFFDYVRSTVDLYRNDSRIGGISLYGFQMNPYAMTGFSPAANGFDAYFMQVGMSWGECWTAEMWRAFYQWYTGQDGIKDDGMLPQAVVNWNDSSWLKYFDRFLAEQNKFFVHPYISLVTNNAETGEHQGKKSSTYQVPLLGGKKTYRLPSLEEGVCYDPFFERILPEEVFARLGLSGNVILDLNALKTDFGKGDYLISTGRLKYRVVRSLALCKRPAEENVVRAEDGEGIYVYDLHTPAKRLPRDNADALDRFCLRGASWHRTLRYTKRVVGTALLDKLKGR